MSKFVSLLSSMVVGAAWFVFWIICDGAGTFLEQFGHSHRRFYACVLWSILLSALAFWLVPSRELGSVLAAVTVLIGLVVGVVWERRG